MAVEAVIGLYSLCLLYVNKQVKLETNSTYTYNTCKRNPFHPIYLPMTDGDRDGDGYYNLLFHLYYGMPFRSYHSI